MARQRRLVWLRPDGSRCVFVHDKIRSTLLEGLRPLADRRVLHGRAAAYLQQHRGDRNAEIAYHFDEAGDSRSALPYALKAAAQARAQYALEVAEQQYGIAVRGAATADASDALSRRSRNWAACLMLRGRYDEAGRAVRGRRDRRRRELRQGPDSQQARRAGVQTRRHGRSDRIRSKPRLRELGKFVPRRWARARLAGAVGRPGRRFCTPAFPTWFVHR